MMKNCLLCFFTMVSLQLTAQVQWINGSIHDFGEIEAGKQVSYAFEFKNQGNTPLSIETTRTTCGCTAAQFSADLIAPGATGTIIVSFDGQIPLGNRFKKKIKVYFKERKKGEKLTIKGTTKA
jgi:hypothetical protein